MISVIVPVFNGELYLDETIQSLLSQTERDLELIIVNDGSTDRTEEIVRSYTDTRIKLINQENMGKSMAMNVGMKHANGEFITFHGADDTSMPSRFEQLLKGFHSEKIGLVHSDMLLINAQNQPIGYWQSNNFLKDHLFSFLMSVGTPYNNASILFRKEVVKDLEFDPPLNIGQDTDFVMRAHENWDSSHIPEPLYLYRRHPHNSTNQYTYESLAKHIRKQITIENLKKHLTELNWQDDQLNTNIFKGKLIVAVSLSKRGLFHDACLLSREVIPYIVDHEKRQFFEGIKAMIENRYEHAVTIFAAFPNRDHLIENYLGESKAFLGRYVEAASHFFKAIEKKPDYYLAMQNLKSIGTLMNHRNIDVYWRRYLHNNG